MLLQNFNDESMQDELQILESETFEIEDIADTEQDAASNCCSTCCTCSCDEP